MFSRLSRLSSDTWYNFFMWLMSVFRKVTFIGFFIFLALALNGGHDNPDTIFWIFYALYAWLGFLVSHPVELFGTFVSVNMFGAKREETFWNYFSDVRMIMGTVTVFVLVLHIMLGEGNAIEWYLYKLYDYGNWGTIWLNVIDFVKSFFRK